MPKTGPVLGLWIQNLSHPAPAPGAWAQEVVTQLEQAAAQGTDILVLPEYACEAWLYGAPSDMTEAGETAYMAQQAASILPALQDAVNRTGTALVAGSTPWILPDTQKPRNRAWVLLPGGKTVIHDKLVLTPPEDEPGGWRMEPGNNITTFSYKGVRYAVLICLDIEMPYLSWLMADSDIDILLVPSYTASLGGYSRVNSCAKARAVELMCAVAVTGCIGEITLPWRREHTICTGGASIYLPCEESLGGHGILMEATPANSSEEPYRVVTSGPIPVATIRKLRHGGAAVWPGKWPASDRIQAIRTEEG